MPGPEGRHEPSPLLASGHLPGVEEGGSDEDFDVQDSVRDGAQVAPLPDDDGGEGSDHEESGHVVFDMPDGCAE